SLAGRSRLAEPEPAADIVAKPAAEPAPKQSVAEVELEGNGVGMTLSGQIQGRKILTSVVPEYTAKARKNGWEGVVAVHFTVLADGRVKDNTYFEQTSVHRDLNQMALEAIKQFRFAPLPNDQAAVEQWGVITIVFRLN
ncbi:MAG: energy transducer TonB, partial [Krumholzibacteria bacterium]|nr:energy transducer TonB [Candidatus Krumholzibacteria bacterium]